MIVREAEAQKQLKDEGVAVPQPEPGHCLVLRPSRAVSILA